MYSIVVRFLIRFSAVIELASTLLDSVGFAEETC